MTLAAVSNTADVRLRPMEQLIERSPDKPSVARPGQRVRIWLAHKLIGPGATCPLIARVAKVDPREVELALRDVPALVEPWLCSSVADAMRMDLIDWHLEQPVAGSSLPRIRALLESMSVPSARGWRALAQRARLTGDLHLETEAADTALRVASSETLPPDQFLEYVIAAAAAAIRSNGARAGNALLQDALRLAAEATQPDALARVLAARTDPGLNLDHAWLARFEQAWEQLGDTDSRTAVELIRAQVYATYLSDHAASTEIAERALAMARRLEDSVALVAALDSKRLVAARSEDIDDLRAPGEELLELGQCGDDDALGFGYEALIGAHLLTGDTGSLDRHLDAYAGLSDRTGRPQHRSFLDSVGVCLALRSGDLDRAERKLNGALTRALASGDSMATLVALAQRAMLTIERGQVSDAIDLSMAQLDDHRILDWWKLVAVLASSRSGDAEYLDTLVPNPEALIEWRFLWLGELVVLADASAAIGDEHRCQVLRSMLEPHSDRYATIGHAVAFGSVWRPLANLAAALGDTDRAEREYRRADDANSRIGAVPALCLGRLGHAEFMLQTGRQADAVAKIEQALAASERRGLARIEAHARELLASVGKQTRPIDVPGLTDRECQLVTVLAEGKTNRELAAEFHLSVKTIERCLSSIYIKLGVANRREAIQAARSDDQASDPS